MTVIDEEEPELTDGEEPEIRLGGGNSGDGSIRGLQTWSSIGKIPQPRSVFYDDEP